VCVRVQKQSDTGAKRNRLAEGSAGAPLFEIKIKKTTKIKLMYARIYTYG